MFFLPQCPCTTFNGKVHIRLQSHISSTLTVKPYRIYKADLCRIHQNETVYESTVKHSSITSTVKDINEGHAGLLGELLVA